MNMVVSQLELDPITMNTKGPTEDKDPDVTKQLKLVPN